MLYLSTSAAIKSNELCKIGCRNSLSRNTQGAGASFTDFSKPIKRRQLVRFDKPRVICFFGIEKICRKPVRNPVLPDFQPDSVPVLDGRSEQGIFPARLRTGYNYSPVRLVD